MSDIGDILDNEHQHTLGHGGIDFYWADGCWKCQQRDASERYHGLCNGCALWLDETVEAVPIDEP